MDNFSEAEKSSSLSPNLNTNSGQPVAPIIYPPTVSSGYPLPGSYSQGQGGYPLPEPVINASAPVYTPLAGMEPPTAEENWMPVPVVNLICPPGLEYLTVIDQLIFHQKGKVLEEMFKFFPKNQFSIKNNVGQSVYSAKEETDWSLSSFFRRIRPFDMKIKDSAGKDVIQMISNLKPGSCCACTKIMEVMSPPGILIGSVEQELTLCYPHLNVLDASGEVVLIIKGPIIGFNFFRDVDFKVLSKDSSLEVGCIRKLYSDFITEAFTHADNFVVTFPMDLDVNIKAVLLGACILIDLLYFEDRGQRNRRRRRFTGHQHTTGAFAHHRRRRRRR